MPSGEFAPEPLEAIRRAMPVECRAVDIELINDVADEGVVFGVLVHGLGVLEGSFAHCL